MIEGLEDRMRARVLQESAFVATEEWIDFLNRLDVPFFNYRGTHVTEVVRIAKYLARETGVDYDVVIMAAWFHDISKPGTIGGGGVHGKEDANTAREYLLKEGVDSDVVEKVCDAIEKHLGYTRDEPVSPLEAQIVWESDKLAKLGITSMIFHLINGLRYEPNANMDGILERMRKSLPGLRKIAASMNTEPGRRIANARMRNYESFISLLESELNMEQ
ncbi:MAG: HD domain-containing protein [Candidatus Heimdallarchaeota archaeon]